MMDNEKINMPSPGEDTKPQEQQDNKINYGPLIGSEGEVTGYDWD